VITSGSEDCWVRCIGSKIAMRKSGPVEVPFN